MPPPHHQIQQQYNPVPPPYHPAPPQGHPVLPQHNIVPFLRDSVAPMMDSDYIERYKRLNSSIFISASSFKEAEYWLAETKKVFATLEVVPRTEGYTCHLHVCRRGRPLVAAQAVHSARSSHLGVVPDGLQCIVPPRAPPTFEGDRVCTPSTG